MTCCGPVCSVFAQLPCTGCSAPPSAARRTAGVVLVCVSGPGELCHHLRAVARPPHTADRRGSVWVAPLASGKHHLAMKTNWRAHPTIARCGPCVASGGKWYVPWLRNCLDQVPAPPHEHCHRPRPQQCTLQPQLHSQSHRRPSPTARASTMASTGRPLRRRPETTFAQPCATQCLHRCCRMCARLSCCFALLVAMRAWPSHPRRWGSSMQLSALRR